MPGASCVACSLEPVAQREQTLSVARVRNVRDSVNGLGFRV